MAETQTDQLQGTVWLARWSAVLGTLGLLTAVFGIGVLLALIAIACAVVALHQLSRADQPDVQGVAVLGLLAGILALLVFPLLLATAVPKFIVARQAARHEQCYENLLAMDAAKQVWAVQHGAPRGTRLPSELILADPSGTRRECPSGGRYFPGPVGIPARCSISFHNEPPARPAPDTLRLSMH